MVKALRTLTIIIASVLFISIPVRSEVLASEGPEVLVLPFTIYSIEDITPLRHTIMEQGASELERSGCVVSGLNEVKRKVSEGKTEFDSEDARRMLKDLGLEYAFTGSLTKSGNIYSIDSMIVTVGSATPILYHHAEAATPNEAAQKIAQASKQFCDSITMVGKITTERKAETIVKVSVKGNMRADSVAVTRNTISKPGTTLSIDSINKDLHSIYSSGLFNDVYAESYPALGGIELVFTVSERPFVKKIVLNGNKKVKDEKLREILTIKENTVLNMAIINDEIANIKATYKERGYYNAKVESSVTTEELNAVITFNIKEGKRLRIRSIKILGNEEISDRKLRKRMLSKKLSILTYIGGKAYFDEEKFSIDKEIIKGYYRDKGYVDVKIIDTKAIIDEQHGYIKILITLSEGEKYRIGDIDVSGDILTTKAEVLEVFGVKKGDEFKNSKIIKGLEAIKFLYGDKGYAFVLVNPLTSLDRENLYINITLDITKNEPVYINNVNIRGNYKTKDRVLRRELEISEGKLFSATDIKMTGNNLRRLGYFSDVKLSKLPTDTPGELDIDIAVQETLTGNFVFGLGYSTEEQLVANASISQSNFIGTGLKLNLNGTVSSTSTNYVLGITEPWIFNKPVSAGIDLFNTTKDYEDFSMSKVGGGLRLGFPIYKRTTRGYISYEYEEVTIKDILDTASDTIKEQEGTDISSSVTLSISHNSTDDFFFPTEGIYARLSAQFAGGMFGGETNFIKYEANARKYFKIPIRDFVFSAEGTFGLLEGLSGDEAPIYERYYLGGINSLRGFVGGTVSPTDPLTGDLIGGTIMAYTNLELTFMLFPESNMQGVIFFDAGNAYDGTIDLEDIKRTAGAGIRWQSPMGPLRLEWGYNLNQKDDETQSDWNFTIGGIF
ncbi:MAG: outer membrane protein assembly factor BamA [Deltaproteobacteria bacterium]|nr:outer membrane protein assembly factor BamA [Deltaproteobacteria bacterium]